MTDGSFMMTFLRTGYSHFLIKHTAWGVVAAILMLFIVYAVHLTKQLLTMTVFAGTPPSPASSELIETVSQFIAGGGSALLVLILAARHGWYEWRTAKYSWIVPMGLALGILWANHSNLATYTVVEAGLVQRLVNMLSVGFYEEMIFRGVLLWFLLNRLRQVRYGIVASVLISGLLFGLIHIFSRSMVQVLYATSIGIVFASLTLRSQLIFPAIVLHSVNNALNVLAGPSALSPTADIASELQYAFVPIMLSLVCVLWDARLSPLSKQLVWQSRDSENAVAQ